MCDLPERWWYRPEVNDAERAVFHKGEPKQRMKARTLPTTMLNDCDSAIATSQHTLDSYKLDHRIAGTALALLWHSLSQILTRHGCDMIIIISDLHG